MHRQICCRSLRDKTSEQTIARQTVDFSFMTDIFLCLAVIVSVLFFFLFFFFFFFFISGCESVQSCFYVGETTVLKVVPNNVIRYNSDPDAFLDIVLKKHT